MPRIITDIDGTILENGNPIKAVIDYIKAEAEEVVILTNRYESDRERTVNDLKKTGLSYERLIMNDTGEPAPAFKKSKVKEYLDNGQRVDEFIDNDAANRAAVSELGVEVTDPATIIANQAEESDSEESMAVVKNPKPLAKLTNKGNQMNPNQTIEQLNEVLASKVDSMSNDISTLTKKLADSDSLLTAAKAELASIEAFKAEASKEKETLVAALSIAEERIKTLEASNKTVEAKAASIVAACSADPAAISPNAETPAKAAQSILEQYNSLTGAERIAFLSANKKAIWEASFKN